MTTRTFETLIFNDPDKDMVLLAIDNSDNAWESYSRELWELAVKLIPTGSVVWDVGSYNGFYSMKASLIRKDIVIFAFEPHPNNANNIKQNLKLNQLDRDIELLELALVGDNSLTEITLHISNDIRMPSGSSIIESAIKPTQRKINVEAMRGDDVAMKPRLVKIDVEGAEYEVLSGMVSILAEQKPIILFEMLEEDSMVLDLLHKHNYTVKRINEKSHTFDGDFSDNDRNYLRIIDGQSL